MGRYLERFPSAAKRRSKWFLLVDAVVTHSFRGEKNKPFVTCGYAVRVTIAAIFNYNGFAISLTGWRAHQPVNKLRNMVCCGFLYQVNPRSVGRDIQANELGQTAIFMLPDTWFDLMNFTVN